MLRTVPEKKFKPAALLLVMLFTQAVYAAQPLPEFSAKYAIQKFGMKLAEASYQLSHTETGYSFTQNTELYGVAGLFSDEAISAVSIIEAKDNNLLLTKHRYTHTGKKKNRNEDISIHWKTDDNVLEGDITGVVRGKKIKLRTDSQIWEVLSFQVPLMIEASRDKKEYPYNAILKGEIDTYHFTLAATENISFAGRQYQALHMVRKDPHKDRQLHLWLIPELHNIPVIVENYRDGKEHSRMQLESIQFDNKKPIIKETAEDDDF